MKTGFRLVHVIAIALCSAVAGAVLAVSVLSAETGKAYPRNHVYQGLIVAHTRLVEENVPGDSYDVSDEFRRALSGDSFSSIVLAFRELGQAYPHSGFESGNEYKFGIGYGKLARLKIDHNMFRRPLPPPDPTPPNYCCAGLEVTIRYNSENDYRVVSAKIQNLQGLPP